MVERFSFSYSRFISVLPKTREPSFATLQPAMEDGIFLFNDRGALVEQSDVACETLYHDFIGVLEQEAPSLLGDQGELVQYVKNLKESYEVSWMASYGCAVLVGNVDIISKSITVIGLDNWKNIIHSSIDQGRQPTAEVDLTKSPAILPVGTIQASAVHKVLEKTKDLLRKTEKGSSKNHKTPSFVFARMMDVMVELKLSLNTKVTAIRDCYQGGTTDVGLHTGCLRRNTAFPLVASMYSAMLILDGQSAPNIFYKSLCVYFLHHLRQVVLYIASSYEN
jgi:hypothetical protein